MGCGMWNGPGRRLMFDRLIGCLAIGWTVIFLTLLIVAMMHGGSVILNVNSLHEGWAEVGVLSVLLVGQVYIWIRRL